MSATTHVLTIDRHEPETVDRESWNAEPRCSCGWSCGHFYGFDGIWPLIPAMRAWKDHVEDAETSMDTPTQQA